ncbi:MAG: DUF2779 domain-containing protein [Chloroflexi bacterium]|nr:DUF2779 domain-containing protein [Chloroflexota bacterium]
MSKPFLSKSKYLIGLQCPKLLWHHYNAKEKLPPVDEQTQAVFDQGHEVGLLAQKLYPDGITVKWDAPFEEVIRQSSSLLKNKKPLFEAGFMFNNGYARVDVLEPVPKGRWDIIEVKSGTSVKDPNCDDVAFQRYCYEGAGVPIRKCHLMHVDNTYVRQGEVDPGKLFMGEDVTEAVAEKAVGLEDRLKEMLRVIKLKDCPEVDIGPHCDAPYSCPLKPVCWKQVDDHESNVFTLYRLGAKAWALYHDGIIRNEQIPPDFRLTETQKIQLEAERTNKPHVNRPVVAEFLAQLQYPSYFLDFETFQTAIPMVDGTRPWQQIPFQFSLHVAKTTNAKPAHYSWLWDGRGDPRKELLDQLSPLLGDHGSIVAFNASFEKIRLNQCVDAYPDYSGWLVNVLARVVDLLSPFRSFDVYYPSQHGSASLKQVLPALTGKNYYKLVIQDGGQASEEFKRITFGEVDEEERQNVRRNLEEYCGLDTMGMLDIVRVLRRLLSGV